MHVSKYDLKLERLYR